VHAGIRNLKPPVRDGVLLLGEDEGHRLVAVALLYDAGRDDDTYLMKLAAVGVTLDCQGSGYGVEAIEMALQAVEARGFGAGCPVVVMVGLVHRSNTSSKRVCAKAGLVSLGRVGEYDEYDDYEQWAASVELNRPGTAEE